MARTDQWKPKDLADCAKKHIAAVPLLKDSNLQAAIYLAGVACEAMFRSLRYGNKREHNSGHNLELLASECGYVEKIPFAQRPLVSIHLQTMRMFWWNELRYANKNHQIRRYMRTAAWQKKYSYANFEDDLRDVYNTVYNAAKFLIDKGVEHAGI